MNSPNEKWKRRVQVFSSKIADKYGFIQYKRTFLIKATHDICLSLCFDFPPTAMRLRAAAQPLFIPEKSPNLTFGCDIKRLNLLEMGYWGKSPERYEDDIAEIEHQITTEVLPFFNRISSPQKLAGYLKSKDSMNIAYVICPPIIRNTYLAYSYLYLKEYSLARRHLENMMSILSEYSDANSQNCRVIANMLLSLVCAHEYAEIDCILKNNILQFRSECGI